MGSFSVCNFCSEYRQCFGVVHVKGQEEFKMCFRCGLSFKGKEVWNAVPAKEGEKVHV